MIRTTEHTLYINKLNRKVRSFERNCTLAWLAFLFLYVCQGTVSFRKKLNADSRRPEWSGLFYEIFGIMIGQIYEILFQAVRLCPSSTRACDSAHKKMPHRPRTGATLKIWKIARTAFSFSRRVYCSTLQVFADDWSGHARKDLQSCDFSTWRTLSSRSFRSHLLTMINFLWSLSLKGCISGVLFGNSSSWHRDTSVQRGWSTANRLHQVWSVRHGYDL